MTTWRAAVTVGNHTIAYFDVEERTEAALVRAYRKWRRENEPRLNRQVSICFVDAPFVFGVRP